MWCAFPQIYQTVIRVDSPGRSGLGRDERGCRVLFVRIVIATNVLDNDMSTSVIVDEHRRVQIVGYILIVVD